jgi:uncharacterized protein (DUF433 family)
MTKRIDLPEQDIIDAYQTGDTLDVIAERYGVGRTAIISRLDKHGIKRRKSIPPDPSKDLPDQDIIDAYKAGATITALAIQYDVDVMTIKRRLDWHNVQTHQHSFWLRIDLPDDEIVRLYLSGISAQKIADQYSVSRWVIDDRLEKHAIMPHKQGSLLRKCKGLNEHYFDLIDTEEKAYFLGLLYADGCNHRGRKKKIDIALQERDKCLLEKFSQSIQD